jgi:hypothetical protein
MAAMDMLIKLAAINPAIANLVPDLMAKYSGLEFSEKLMERLQTLLPPQILAKEKGLPPPPPPPPPPPDPKIMAAQAKAQTDMQANQIKQQELQFKQQELMQKYQKAGLDYSAAKQKAAAEIMKSNNELQKAAYDRDTNVAQANADAIGHANDIVQKIQEAEQRRADLDAQSNVLRTMNI